MDAAAWGQLLALVAVIAITTPLLGSYLARVYGDGTAPGDRVFGPLERGIYRLVGVDERQEQRWTIYVRSVLAFSVASIVFLYLLQRVQGVLPLNPTDVGAVSPTIAFNTAVSFVTNTNWQSYSPESTMSDLTQMVGLAVQNFASAAVGMAVAIAFVRGLVRRRSATIGNFWVDLTRTVTRVLLPLAFVGALILVSQGVVQNFSGSVEAHTVGGSTQVIPGGPVASQEVIKELGTNGGGYYNANSAHPFENPNGFTNFLQMALILLIPFALTYTFGTMAKNRRQGWAVFAAMFVLWAGSVVAAMTFESNGNPLLDDRGVTQELTATQSGGNL
jgi:K+-transporting ATPase ATPase A chain